MARLNKIAISLCALLFTSISFTPLAHASGHTHASATPKAHQAKGTSERKKKVSTQKTKSSAKTSSKKASTSSRAKHPTRTTASSQTALNRQVAGGTKKCVLRKGYKKQCAASVKSTIEPTRAMASVKQKCVVRKGYKKRCKPVAEEEVPLTLADAHKVRVQKAQSTAMSKLMDQIGKPYRWGGTSPRTGFDCSGLVYYAYKDLVKIHIPRTANEMYHLRDARPVDRGELESGDLVFFRTRGRGTADHVGVYVGNGKFIQSPRTGRDIQITSLSEDYWVRHYVGARRVMTPKTIR
ncbi:C40 family peptidase [Raoultella terrigena]|uniref:C40 family peptidase n=1 Tax=Raoultella terrigena TaxID=577 RepID=A0A485BQ22_RAOTE|nr:C40 family peptidase [Raoultella terrigena]AJF73578.1 endopeptidase [Raoultella ornithinolytica]HCR58308.1 peptidoglycan endopeptidase [Raoultella sp.]MCE9901224.1 C40 family peptidase [Raoultella terrigena]MEB7598720.1 C40 family peptidase [Raoultella terrigena]QPF10870.1 C40 family peptidase [Raoultella terrigena]